MTDIEKSTEKWEKYRTEMNAVLARHDAILRDTIENYEGSIVKHTGDGVFAVFEGGAPLHCAVALQKYFEEEKWGKIGELRIRIGLHAGEAEKRGNDYFGAVVNRTQRIMAAAWGGQILLTPEVKDRCTLPTGAQLRDFGLHVLHDLGEPQQIYGLIHSDLMLIDFPPIHSLSAHPHNLPSQETPFVGREHELEEVKKLLDNPTCRLVNVVGPGGIGKTRLAVHAAALEVERFRHGVYFVPLDALTIGSIQFLVFTIADSLKFSFYSREDPKMQLLNYLREKEMLLLMDNFEHLIAEAELLKEIYENAPEIKFLVTSRERLRLKGEWTIELHGLNIPRLHLVPDFETFSAIQLFVQSAQRVAPDFVLQEVDKLQVLKICRLIEGIPLGIELAASWVRSLSIDEIAHEMERGLDFLSTTLQDIPRRHQSLRAVFDYSWNLLSKKEQRIFSSLAVFHGGFNRDAAQKIADASLSDLTTLSDKSLVHRTSGGRYELLKILRQYANEHLLTIPDEKERKQQVHCNYFADVFHRRETDPEGESQNEFFYYISEEIENIRAAWQWALEHQDVETIAKFMKGLYSFYETKGWLQEGEQVLRMTADMLRIKYGSVVKDTDKKRFFATVLARWGGLLRRLSEYTRSREVLEESLVLFQELEVKSECAYVMNELGVIAYRCGDYATAQYIHQEVLKIRQAEGTERQQAVSYNNLGVVALAVGDYEQAKVLHQKALAIRESIGDKRGMATSMNNLGNVMHRLGNDSVARGLYEKSLEIREEINDRAGIASCLNNLGLMLEGLGDYEEAKRLYRESLLIKKEIGDQRGMGNSLENLGSVSLRMGELKEAKKYFSDALEMSLRINAIPIVLDVLHGVVPIFRRENKLPAALTCSMLVVNHPASTRETREKAQLVIEDLRSGVSADEIQEISDLVKSVSFKGIVERVLKGLE